MELMSFKFLTWAKLKSMSGIFETGAVPYHLIIHSASVVSGALDGHGQKFVFKARLPPLFRIPLVFAIHTACIIGASSEIYSSQRKFQCPSI